MPTVPIKITTLSRKEVKDRLQLSNYILKRLLADAGCTDILERPDQRIFPISAWMPLLDYFGIPLEDFARK